MSEKIDERTVNIHDELKEFGCSVLITLKKANIFSLPESYFDDLAADITRIHLATIFFIRNALYGSGSIF